MHMEQQIIVSVNRWTLYASFYKYREYVGDRSRDLRIMRLTAKDFLYVGIIMAVMMDVCNPSSVWYVQRTAIFTRCNMFVPLG